MTRAARSARSVTTVPHMIERCGRWLAGDVIHLYKYDGIPRLHIVEAVGPSGEPRLGRDLLTGGTP